jgi:hypothetical protein
MLNVVIYAARDFSSALTEAADSMPLLLHHFSMEEKTRLHGPAEVHCAIVQELAAPKYSPH